MEYNSIGIAMFCIVVAIVWSLDFWKMFKRERISVSRLQERYQAWRAPVRFIIFLVGFVGWLYLSYAMTQPRQSKGYSPSSKEVVDIILVVDVSRSMLAEDLPPNRLEATKNRLREFAKKRITDRIGLIVFSEKVFTLMPLSTDPELLEKVIGDIQIGYLGSGTNIGDGVGLAVARAIESEAKNKVIILLTDGVNNVGNLTPMQAANEAKKNNIKVYTIGVGSKEDAKIPVGKSVFGNQYQLIPGGSIDYETLSKMSELTGGRFYPATDESALGSVFDDIDNLERTEIKIDNQVVYEEFYYGFFAIGLLLISICELAKRAILREVQ
jgi:Ca-activated chloride channel homolog